MPDAAGYIELNSVRAGLFEFPGYYPWSSAQENLNGREKLSVAGMVEDWTGFLSLDAGEEEALNLRRPLRTSHPLGADGFLLKLETSLNHALKKRKTGQKKTKQVLRSRNLLRRT